MRLRTGRGWGRRGVVMLAAGLAAGVAAVAPGVAGAAAPTGAGSIAAGGAHACALATGQTVKCWGLDNAGQLGNGASGNGLIAKKPVSVVGLKGVSAVAAGDDHSCALLKVLGNVECWGLNNAGQLGNGTRKNSSKPVFVQAVGGGGAIRGVIAIAAAGNHTCALRSAAAGVVVCWGQNNAGVLGNGSATRLQALIPESVNGLTRVTAISTSANDTCALLKGGSLKCWGFNEYGELGPGTYGPNSCDGGEFSFGCSTTPMTVKGISNVIAVSVRPHSTCAAVKNGRLICWGQNVSPNSVVAKGFVTLKGVAGVTALASPGDVVIHGDDEFSCALLSSQDVKCWGANNHGQLGNGSTVSSAVPTYIATKPAFASAISAGGDFACARVSLGPVLCWGDNGYGQLGNGGAPSHNRPVFVAGL